MSTAGLGPTNSVVAAATGIDRAPMGPAHALVVGVGDYVHAPSLPAGVRRGAEELAALLRDPDAGGYPPGQVRLLTDREVTVDALREELSVLATVAGEDSTVLVYFAGHGGAGGGGGGATGQAGGPVHLFPAAADPSSADRLAKTALGGRELAHLLDRIRSRCLLAVFDCCHAGGLATWRRWTAREDGAGDDGASDGGESLALQPLPAEYCESLAAPGGRVVLSASRPSRSPWK